MKLVIMGLAATITLSSCAALQHDAPADIVVEPADAAEAETVTIIKVSEDDAIIIADEKMAKPAEPQTCAIASADGFCGAAFGATRQQLEASFPMALKVAFEDPDSPNCYYMQVAEEDQSYYFMILDGQFQRLDVYGTNVETPLGARVGLPFESIQRLHPNSVRQPNPYISIFDDLIIDLDAEHRAILEQDGADVAKSMRIGLTGAVNLIEGCS